jgi:RNA polymerase sigma factor (sigma-70 family)
VQVKVIEAPDRRVGRVAGEEQAWPADFEAVVHAHGARLIRNLTLITLEPGLAEDAAQEAFLQLYLHWGHLGEKDRVPWLYRVAINRCKDYRRALSRAARLARNLAGSLEEHALESWAPDPGLISMLRPLPKRQRTAAALFYLGGFSTSEVARAMGISEGAVGSHLHKAREALRKTLEEE